MIRIGLTPGLRHAGSGGGPVVAIRNISNGNGGKRINELLRILHPPNCVTHVLVIGKVIERFRLHFLVNQLIYRYLPLVGQKNRAGLRIQRIHVASPIVFFGRHGSLMLQDNILFVLLRMAGRHQARLRSPAHDKPVQEQTGICIGAKKSGFYKRPKIIACLPVHQVIVQVHARREIDFRPYNPQKTRVVAVGETPRLLRVYYVVRRTGHSGSQCHWWS